MANQYTSKFPESFWSKVNKQGSSIIETLCWEWTGSKDKSGYGTLRSPFPTSRSHRVSYAMHYGPYDYSLKVLHRCDNPSCVNPSHLSVGSQRDNMIDLSNKGRKRNNATWEIQSYDLWLSTRPQKTKEDECRKGHSFSDLNTRIKFANNSWKRMCRQCQYETANIDPILAKVKSFVRKVEHRAEVVAGLYAKVVSNEAICFVCKINPFECFDHIIPKSKGGLISVDNIQPCCLSCNLKKGNRE